MRSNEDPIERFLKGLDFVQKSCVVLYLFVTTSIGELNIIKGSGEMIRVSASWPQGVRVVL